MTGKRIKIVNKSERMQIIGGFNNSTHNNNIELNNRVILVHDVFGQNIGMSSNDFS